MSRGFVRCLWFRGPRQPHAKGALQNSPGRQDLGAKQTSIERGIQLRENCTQGRAKNSERCLNGSKNKGRRPKSTEEDGVKVHKNEERSPAGCRSAETLPSSFKIWVCGHSFLWLQKGSNELRGAYFMTLRRGRKGKEGKTRKLGGWQDKQVGVTYFFFFLFDGVSASCKYTHSQNF